MSLKKVRLSILNRIRQVTKADAQNSSSTLNIYTYIQEES